jgi:hypothetical protein
MGAMKRELERLADIIIYGNPETITREFNKVASLADGAAVAEFAYAVEMAREMMPLCECGADYFQALYDKYPQYVEQTNTESGN